MGVSRQTIANYLDLLEKSYLIRTLPVLSASPDRELVKARKTYCYRPRAAERFPRIYLGGFIR